MRYQLFNVIWKPGKWKNSLKLSRLTTWLSHYIQKVLSLISPYKHIIHAYTISSLRLFGIYWWITIYDNQKVLKMLSRQIIQKNNSILSFQNEAIISIRFPIRQVHYLRYRFSLYIYSAWSQSPFISCFQYFHFLQYNLSCWGLVVSCKYTIFSRTKLTYLDLTHFVFLQPNELIILWDWLFSVQVIAIF